MAIQSSIDVDGRGIIGSGNTIGSINASIIGANNNATTLSTVDSNTNTIIGDSNSGRYGNTVITDRTLRLGRTDNTGASSLNTTGVLNFNDSVQANQAFSNVGGFVGYFPPPTSTNDYYFFNAYSENVLDSVFQAGASPTASRMNMSTSPTLNCIGYKFDANTTNGGGVYYTVSNNSSTASSRGIVTFDCRHQNQNYEAPDGHSLFEITSGYGRTKFLIKQVNGSSNVGIGTTNPQEKLHIAADNNPKIKLQTTSPPGGFAVYGTIDAQNGFLTWANVTTGIIGTRWQYTGPPLSGRGDSYINLHDTNGVDIIVNDSQAVKIEDGGNVGIGDTNPGQKLSVAPSTDVSGEFGYAHVGNVGYNGYAGFSHVDRNSQGNYALLQEASGTTFLNASSGQSIRFRINNSDKMLLDSSGNVGIGTSPSQKLHVSGNARVTGAYYDSSNSPGTSGQVLSSTATGTDWVSAGGTSGFAPMVKFNRSGINSSTYTMIATVNGNNLASVLKMTMTGTSNSVVFACAFDITVNHSQDIHVKSSNGDYTEVTLRITSDGNEDFSIEAKHNGSTTTQAEVCIFPLADEIITPTTTDPGYTGAEYEHTATEGWRYGGVDSTAESSNVIVDGKLGVGTTNPTSRLHSVTTNSGPTDYRNRAAILGINDSTDTIYANSVGVAGKVSTSGGLAIYGDTSGAGGWAGYFDGKGYFSGNVGIGTTSLSEKLVVAGNASITNNLYVGSGNTLKSCTYSAQNSLVVGSSNTLGGISNGIIGIGNTIECTNEPWLNLGGNFIAGLNNEINNLYSHANAAFGQDNAIGAFDTPSNSVAGILVCGNVNSVNGNNSLAFGYSCFVDQYADNSLTGGFDSNNFGFYGSVAIGAGATASAGNNQYAFGTGVTTPTFSGNAYGPDQFVVGKFNEYTNSSFLPHRFAVGNGSSDASRDTPFCVIGSGTYTNGQVSINDADGFAYTSIPYSVFHVNGRATSSYSSTFTTTSDERVKKNIVDYSKGLAEIIQVQPKSYAFNGKGNTIEDVESIGVLAQEIKEVFPETVGTVNKKLNPEDEQETELYTVDISPVTYALINAVKELNAKIETLEARIQTLEGN
jgi:hypothetical protein